MCKCVGRLTAMIAMGHHHSRLPLQRRRARGIPWHFATAGHWWCRWFGKASEARRDAIQRLGTIPRSYWWNPVKLGHARPSFHFLPSLFIHSLNLFVTNMTKSSGDDKYRWSDPRPKSGPAYCFWFETYACSAADILWKGRAHSKSPFDLIILYIWYHLIDMVDRCVIYLRYLYGNILVFELSKMRIRCILS